MCYIFPNQIKINGINVKDQAGCNLLNIKKVKANILLPKFSELNQPLEDINLSLIDIERPCLFIVRNVDSVFNFQFIVDSLKSDNTDSGTKLFFKTINIYNLQASYIDHCSNSHYKVSNLNLIANDVKLDSKGVSVSTKDISFERISAHTKGVKIHAEAFDMNGCISYNSGEDKIVAELDKVSFIYNHDKYAIEDSKILYQDNIFDIKSLDLCADNGLIFQGSGNIKDNEITADIDRMSLSAQNLVLVKPYTTINKDIEDILAKLGDISIHGKAEYIDAQIHFNGDVTTRIGKLNSDIKLEKDLLSGAVNASNLQLGNLINEPKLGNATFSIDGEIDINKPLEENHLTAVIKNIEYSGYQYNDINIDETISEGKMDGVLSVNDPRMKLTANLSAETNFYSHTLLNNIKANIDLYAERLALYPILKEDTPASIAMKANANISSYNYKTATGNVVVENMYLVSDKQTYELKNYELNVDNIGDGKRNIIINTDFVNAEISGDVEYESVWDGLLTLVNKHLPSLVPKQKDCQNDYVFDITLKQSEIFDKLVEDKVTLDLPIHVSGYVNDISNMAHAEISIPWVHISGNELKDSHIIIEGMPENMTLKGEIIKVGETSTSNLNISAVADNNIIQSTLDWNLGGSKNIHGQLNSATSFEQTTTGLLANIDVDNSMAYFDEMAWTIHPSHIEVQNGCIKVNELELISEDKFIWASGVVSENPSDSITTEFKGFDIAYLQDLLNFHPVRFGGEMSGHAQLSNLYHTPDISAEVVIDSMLFEKGFLGKAVVNVGWDKVLKGISINGHIVDEEQQTDIHQWPIRRVTDVNGYVIPGEVHDDIQLAINAQNTSAEFVNGFLGGVFKDVKGSVNGLLNVTTSGNQGVNLIGKMSVDADLILRATNTLYHVDKRDSIEFIPRTFVFDNVRIHDSRGKTGYVKGTVTHQKLRNFGYGFDVSFNDLLIYDEKEFNSDKFLATVFGTGVLHLNGSDGHDLRMNADITPTKGSIFAYDAATPDAITTGSFITFRDKSKLQNDSLTVNSENTTENEISHEYSSDVYMDINIHVNPDCTVKLRMDNNEDGYITTHGNGTLLARYHDKSPFTMQGIYQIESGKYRLYLQDIIYRDLELQEGSNVTFNGNPFDANIHLICWHTLPAVPLRDLTSSAEFMQNNKVKVICALDITGKLGNMNFGFDVQLPNVSDETRQLVKSLISTEEEMNMQMIYLLGLGRFYTNEIARAQGKTSSGTEMSSLAASTISGQINNILDNALGNSSNWSFGTGLSTGEKGWDDLDVEGTLSGSLLNDRLLINGNFGYRDNTLTNKANFVGDFDVRYRLRPDGNIYLKAYNQTNDKYFTKSTLNTQGIGISFLKEFDNWRYFLKRNKKKIISTTNE